MHTHFQALAELCARLGTRLGGLYPLSHGPYFIYASTEKDPTGHQSFIKPCSNAHPLNLASFDAAQRLWLQSMTSQAGLASGTIEADKDISLQKL